MISSSTMHSFARRGVETVHRFVNENGDREGGDGATHISPVAALIFLLTVIVFAISLFTISYTYGHVITTLCMIESPETNAYVPVNSLSTSEEPPAYTEEEDEDGTPKPAEPETLLVRTKPFTSSIRQTLIHLRARAGYWSRFRGLGLYFIWGFIRNIIIGFITMGSANPLLISLAAILAEVALAHVHMTWIHIVISEPSEKKWYRRIPTLRGNWIKIAPAVLLWAFVGQVVHILPMLICGSWGALKHMQDPHFNPGKKEMYITATQLSMAMILTLLMFIGLQIPATVTMVRVAASMLPEEDETIVPFDRTYGGKVTPAIVGGQGKIGLVEAWKSFPWSSRKRLLVLCAKVAAIVVAVWMLFSFVVVLEAHLLFGAEAFGDMMKMLHHVKRPN